MAPKVAPLVEDPGAGSGQGSMNTAKLDNYVPVFSNVQKEYREYRKRAELYRRKMELGKRQAETVYNLVTMMTGKAWDLVEDLTPEQLAAADGFDLVFARLDKGFRYDPLTELPDDFEQYFVKLQRKNQQTLQDYMTEYSRAERKLKATHSIELPEKVRAWWFLRRSGVTKDQRQLILTHIGTAGLTLDEVQKAMSFILGQDSKLDAPHHHGSRWNKAKDVYYHDEDGADDWFDDAEDDDSPVHFAWRR